MDQLTRYRGIIRSELDSFAVWMAKADSSLRYEVVHDPAADHFELIQFGWRGRQRVHSTVFHLDIVDGKVWVQHDATDRPIAEELARAGIPKSDIVLAEKPVELRPLTGFGVG